MSFANPRALLILIFVLAGFGLNFLYSLKLQSKLSAWIDRKLWPQIIPDFSKSIFIRKNVLLLLGIFFLMIAMARPQWGEREDIIESQGMDILFLLDLSNSMLAEDTPPSRLSRAQTFIKKTLEGLADDRVGIVGFAGKAFLTVPLTTDFGYVSEMTDTLNPASMLSQGTNIAQAIETGIKAFERGAEDNHKTSRAIVLISDGEDFGEDAKVAANKLKDFGAGFFTVSVGTKEGAPIPVRNDVGILQTYKKDRGEKPILSRVNRELLSKLADEGGGSFLELVNPDDASYTLSKSLRALNRDSRKDQRQVVKIDRYQYFLSVSILFLILALFTGYRPLRKLALILLFFAPQISGAQTLKSYLKSKSAEKSFNKKEYDDASALYEEAKKLDPESTALLYNEATTLANGKKPEEAASQFDLAARQALSEGDYDVAARSLYNEGITHSEQKHFHESYDRLTKAIELAKITNQPDLEKKSREALINVVEKQKQQKKEKQKEDQGDSQKKQQSSSSDQKKDESKDSQDQKKDQQQNPRPDEGKKREFKSGTLSKDVAESIMNDLSDREKQLYQQRLKERKPKEVENDKDW